MVLLWCIGLSAIIPEAGRKPPLCQAQKTFARKIDHRVRCGGGGGGAPVKLLGTDWFTKSSGVL